MEVSSGFFTKQLLPLCEEALAHLGIDDRTHLRRLTMTMTMTHSEKSNFCQMKAWPHRQECWGHDPTKKNLLCC